MKIIKHGDIEKIKGNKNPFVFECSYCGCIYETNTDEIEIKQKSFHAEKKIIKEIYVYYCKCPDCGRMNVNDD